MGAHDDARTFEAPNEKAALKRADQIMEQERYEEGSGSYAGHIGIAAGVKVHHSNGPMTPEAAREWLFGSWDQKTGVELTRGHAEKWENAWLIQIRNKGSRKKAWILGAVVSS